MDFLVDKIEVCGQSSHIDVYKVSFFIGDSDKSKTEEQNLIFQNRMNINPVSVEDNIHPEGGSSWN